MFCNYTTFKRIGRFKEEILRYAPDQRNSIVLSLPKYNLIQHIIFLLFELIAKQREPYTLKKVCKFTDSVKWNISYFLPNDFNFFFLSFSFPGRKILDVVHDCG